VVNGALFVQGQDSIVGTGAFDPFVRIQRTWGAGHEEGYNTDARPVEFQTLDETHSIRVGDLAEVTIGGIRFREFALDINEPAGPRSEISLDRLRIHIEDSGSLTGYRRSRFGPPVYDLDWVTSNWIRLDYDLEGDSGNGIDMFAYVPSVLFGADEDRYVYLYSKFGSTISASGGFEEWRAAKAAGAGSPAPGQHAPEPIPAALVALGCLLAAWKLRRL
jgi:hypothetical protein